MAKHAILVDTLSKQNSKCDDIKLKNQMEMKGLPLNNLQYTL